eukprot:COSAG05_NODE_365_length_10774_cov_121.347822_5_plen_119_part_00
MPVYLSVLGVCTRATLHFKLTQIIDKEEHTSGYGRDAVIIQTMSPMIESKAPAHAKKGAQSARPRHVHSPSSLACSAAECAALSVGATFTVFHGSADMLYASTNASGPLKWKSEPNSA